jgi:chemotaxis protein histidine kinase CheA
MTTREDEFRERLRATFKVEAMEHLQTIGSGLLALEKAPQQERERIVESAFRAAHSLKGAARAVNFTEIERICQSLEDVFASWKVRQIAPSPAALDEAHRMLNAMSAALATFGGVHVAARSEAVTSDATSIPPKARPKRPLRWRPSALRSPGWTHACCRRRRCWPRSSPPGSA